MMLETQQLAYSSPLWWYLAVYPGNPPHAHTPVLFPRLHSTEQGPSGKLNANQQRNLRRVVGETTEKPRSAEFKLIIM